MYIPIKLLKADNEGACTTHIENLLTFFACFSYKAYITIKLLKADNVRTFTVAYRKSFDVLLLTFLTRKVS